MTFRKEYPRAVVGEGGNSEGKRKRKKLSSHGKLLVDERVEVRSLKEGFRGSWNSGTVMACESQARRVRYDHIFCDDGSRHLIECIKVPPIIDGIIPASRDICNYRGLIRPLPPLHDFQKCSLHYGQCVDVYYGNAWWEGVLFDNEDSSKERTIFFPDLGDEMHFLIDNFRLTHDWDEFSEEWKPRGDWLFLDLVKEFEQYLPLQVSVRQIWYEVRGKKGFQRLEQWTSINSDIWKELVWGVIVDNCHIAIHHFFRELELSGEFVQRAVPPLSEPNIEDKPLTEADLGNSLGVFENHTLHSSVLPTDLGNATVPPVAEEINLDGFTAIEEDGRLDSELLTKSDPPSHEEKPFNLNEFCGLYSKSKRTGFSSLSSKTPSGKFKHQRIREGSLWRPAGLDIVPRAEFCPDSVTEYYIHKSSVASKLRMHLAYLGWKIEFAMGTHSVRMRYTTPDGKLYYSLVKVCEALMNSALELIPFSSTLDDKINSAPVSEEHLSFPLSKHPHASWEPSSYDMVVESEYFPQAVLDYAEMKDKHFNSEDNVLELKAKKHLSAIGWSFWYVLKEEAHGKSCKELWYSSPHGRKYNSLHAACEDCMKEGGVNGNASTSRPIQNMNVSEDGRCQLLASERLSSTLSVMDYGKDCLVEPAGISSPTELVELRKPPVKEIKKLRRKKMNGLLPLFQRKGQNAYFRMVKKRKIPGSPIKRRHDCGSDFSTHLVRSSKQARQTVASSSSYQNARTVLSWLIDNNVVLPRAKVRYIGRKNNQMAEGRITRNGIRCSCCHTNFSLSKFEAHAGSTCHRPAANIFLQDGRSLLDCQSELKKCYSKQNATMEPKEVMDRCHRYTNDNICTACRDGGDLILCDRCPSSFHTSCLGMKEVPPGDWFCPSCCCGICGRSRLDNDTGNNFMDVSVLTCDQCEHQYHVGCLRKTGVAVVDMHPKGSWFCNNRCKKISLGLHKLLGKSVSVGFDNLTWTVLKYIKHDADDHDGSDRDALTENYSKLHVALSVMHECFEPVKESRTGRDLVEDVIFSRWSELNRLNFQGFYTVILERNDELITAATVRVLGEKVAEVPLVGTRFKYRRLGMCRILMNEIEKNLIELGVERLVLPAVPTLLNTWTGSFGFSKMTSSERLSFLDYTFLDFQGTITCQKFLRKIPSTDLRLIIRTQNNVLEIVSGIDNIDLNGKSAISEADKVEKSEIVDQEPADIVVDDGGSDDGSITAPPGFEMKQPNLEYHLPSHNGNYDYSPLLKCYKRRKISNCQSC